MSGDSIEENVHYCNIQERNGLIYITLWDNTYIGGFLPCKDDKFSVALLSEKDFLDMQKRYNFSNDGLQELFKLMIVTAHLWIKQEHAIRVYRKRYLKLRTELRKLINIQMEQISEDSIRIFERRLRKLTPKEKEILNLYAKGKKNPDILQLLGVQETTLKFHSKNIYTKLGVKNRRELLLFIQKLNKNQILSH